MAKQIIFREKAKEGLKRGIDAVSDAVKITLGPKSTEMSFWKKVTALRLSPTTA